MKRLKKCLAFVIARVKNLILSGFWGGTTASSAAKWTYIGNCTGYSGEGTSELIFTCGTAKVSVKACSPEIIKVWCEPAGTFARKYPSFAVQNENLSPVNLNVDDNGNYYQFSTAKIVVRAYKSPFRLAYYDTGAVLLTSNTASKGMGWSTDGETGVWNDSPADEHYWGLGEKKEAYDRRFQRVCEWGMDVGANLEDPLGPAPGEGESWYGADTHFLSSRGYSIYFDNTGRTIFDMARTVSAEYNFGSVNPAPGGELLYYFIYGPTNKQMVKNYTDLTGKSFMPPIWAFGNGQCHWGYTQSDIESVAGTYRSKNIPCDTMWADIEWYKEYSTPRAWNPVNFPDPQTMLNDLTAQGFKMGVIDDPNVTNTSADYTIGVNNGYFLKNSNDQVVTVDWPWGGDSGIVDFFNPGARSWWKGLHNHLADEGIDCYWTDMNEPARYSTAWTFHNESGGSKGDINEMHNVFAQQHSRTVYESFKDYANKRPFVLTRSFFSGSSKYASPWSGDTDSGWADLDAQLRMGTSMGLSGYLMWGFDIGGFAGNATDDQFKRWVELAAFAPTHRFHYAIGTSPNVAWAHGAEDISRKYITQRERLIPYFYSCTADSVLGTGLETGLGSGGTGAPLMRSLSYEFSNDPNTYTNQSEFMCGPDFLVAPVTDPAYVKSVYFPEGSWYDYSDGKTLYTGQSTVNYEAPIDKLPVFAKAGAIIPMMPAMKYYGQNPIDQITLDVFPLIENGTSSFVLYEDDGATFAYQSGQYCTTKYECTVDKNASTNQQTTAVKINARQQGSDEYTPAARSYMLQLHKSNLGNLSVKKDDLSLTPYTSLTLLNAAASGWYADSASEICYVKLADNAEVINVTLSGSIFNK
jgi:alpha-glucosidase (family GH31 glycosyl hydrolase)